VRRLAGKLAPATIQEWAAVVEAGHSGRDPLPRCNPVAEWVTVAEAQGCKQSEVQPWVMGRHLIERAVRPGPAMGRMLRAAFAAQVDGSVTTFDEAVAIAMAVI